MKERDKVVMGGGGSTQSPLLGKTCLLVFKGTETNDFSLTDAQKGA